MAYRKYSTYPVEKICARCNGAKFIDNYLCPVCEGLGKLFFQADKPHKQSKQHKKGKK